MPLKKLTLLFFVGMLMLSAKRGHYDTNAKIKAVYLYNFTKYIEWPKADRGEQFVFGVIGNAPVTVELENIAKTKKVADRPIVIKKYSAVNEVSKCHILFVSPETSGQISSITGKIKGQSTLLVTDQPGLANKGAAINFVIHQNRQKFELNQSNAARYNLKVSNSLEALAILVN